MFIFPYQVMWELETSKKCERGMVGISAEHSAGSRPLNKGGGGQVSKKIFFSPLGLSLV